ncbi:MAG: lactonase family protein [Nannocystaceae bacterium]
MFHPNKEVSYVINEFTNSIIVSQVEKSGVFKVLQKISTLPNGVKKESFAADIHISNDGKFLYASNRGHNSISAFSISEKGQLTFVSNTNVEGNWPRNFSYHFCAASNKRICSRVRPTSIIVGGRLCARGCCSRMCSVSRAICPASPASR